ncbi:MAG: hypothetical protein KJT03_14490 [Verrucomicrobiae bacterium]|nr:hypothetical protein [Verrucomicrobiae bacterium]
MPTEYHIDPEHSLVISRGTDNFRYDDYLQHMRVVLKDEAFKPVYDHLVDCRNFAEIEVTGAEMEKLSKNSVFSNQAKRAFVVSSELQFGLGRMHSSLRELAGAPATAVFRTVGEALNYLNLPEDYDVDAIVHWKSVN